MSNHELSQLGSLMHIGEDVEAIRDAVAKALEYGVEGNTQLVTVPVSTAAPNDVDLGSFRSILLFNEGTVDVYVGFGNETGVANRRAFTLRASSWIAVPYRGNMVSLGSTAAATTVAVVPLAVPLLAGAGGGGGSGGSFSGALTGPFGRLADAASLGVALSTEDVAVLNAIVTALAGPIPVTGSITASGVIGGAPVTGVIYDQAGNALTPKFAKISTSSSGASQVVAAVATKKIRVVRWDILVNAAVNVKFQSHVTPTDLTGLYYFGANGGKESGFAPSGHFETVAGEALDINLSGAVAVGGSVTYVEA